MNNTENTQNTPRKSVNLSICGGSHKLVDFELVKSSKKSLSYRGNMSITNYQNFTFSITIERHIRIFEKHENNNNNRIH